MNSMHQKTRRECIGDPAVSAARETPRCFADISGQIHWFWFVKTFFTRSSLTIEPGNARQIRSNISVLERVLPFSGSMQDVGTSYIFGSTVKK